MSAAATPTTVVLETAAQEFADATSTPPFIYQLPPAEAREVLESVQRSPIDKPDVGIEDIAISGGPQGQIAVRLIKPAAAAGTLPVILYIHGAGWVLGSPQTHDLLVRNLAVGAQAAVVFPHYMRAPEAQYPSQINEAFATAEWIVDHGSEHGLDPARLAIAGDSCGGNLAIAVTLMAKERGGPSFAAQLLYYPVTDAGLDTGSYHQFAEGYFLTRPAMASPTAKHWIRRHGPITTRRADQEPNPPPQTPARRRVHRNLLSRVHGLHGDQSEDRCGRARSAGDRLRVDGDGVRRRPHLGRPLQPRREYRRLRPRKARR